MSVYEFIYLISSILLVFSEQRYEWLPVDDVYRQTVQMVVDCFNQQSFEP